MRKKQKIKNEVPPTGILLVILSGSWRWHSSEKWTSKQKQCWWSETFSYKAAPLMCIFNDVEQRVMLEARFLKRIILRLPVFNGPLIQICTYIDTSTHCLSKSWTQAASSCGIPGCMHVFRNTPNADKERGGKNSVIYWIFQPNWI